MTSVIIAAIASVILAPATRKVLVDIDTSVRTLFTAFFLGYMLRDLLSPSFIGLLLRSGSDALAGIDFPVLYGVLLGILHLVLFALLIRILVRPVADGPGPWSSAFLLAVGALGLWYVLWLPVELVTTTLVSAIWIRMF